MASAASDSDGKPASECAICLDPYTKDGIHRVVVTKCGHAFGESCIHEALRNKAVCPTCRKPVKKKDLIRLFDASISAVDSGTIDRLKLTADEENRRRVHVEVELNKHKAMLRFRDLEIARLLQQNQSLMERARALEVEIRLLRHPTDISPGFSGLLKGSSAGNNSSSSGTSSSNSSSSSSCSSSSRCLYSMYYRRSGFELGRMVKIWSVAHMDAMSGEPSEVVYVIAPIKTANKYAIHMIPLLTPDVAHACSVSQPILGTVRDMALTRTHRRIGTSSEAGIGGAGGESGRSLRSAPEDLLCVVSDNEARVVQIFSLQRLCVLYNIRVSDAMPWCCTFHNTQPDILYIGAAKSLVFVYHYTDTPYTDAPIDMFAIGEWVSSSSQSELPPQPLGMPILSMCHYPSSSSWPQNASGSSGSVYNPYAGRANVTLLQGSEHGFLAMSIGGSLRCVPSLYSSRVSPLHHHAFHGATQSGNQTSFRIRPSLYLPSSVGDVSTPEKGIYYVALVPGASLDTAASMNCGVSNMTGSQSLYPLVLVSNRGRSYDINTADMSSSIDGAATKRSKHAQEPSVRAFALTPFGKLPASASTAVLTGAERVNSDISNRSVSSSTAYGGKSISSASVYGKSILATATLNNHQNSTPVSSGFALNATVAPPPNPFVSCWQFSGHYVNPTSAPKASAVWVDVGFTKRNSNAEVPKELDSETQYPSSSAVNIDHVQSRNMPSVAHSLFAEEFLYEAATSRIPSNDINGGAAVANPATSTTGSDSSYRSSCSHDGTLSSKALLLSCPDDASRTSVLSLIHMHAPSSENVCELVNLDNKYRLPAHATEVMQTALWTGLSPTSVGLDQPREPLTVLVEISASDLRMYSININLLK